MEVNNTIKRERYIDVVAGIMISWMILGHCCYFSKFDLSFGKFLAFYMPWFFYKSGLFFSPKNYKQLLKKDRNKLLRAFFIYSFIGWIVWASTGMIDGSLDIKNCFIKPILNILHQGSIAGNGALWFLISLFFVRQISNTLIKTNYSPAFLSTICFIIAFALYIIRWQDYCWWFGNFFSGMCFFLLGYWLKKKEKKNFIFLFAFLFYGLVICAYFGGWIKDFPYLYMHANRMYKGNYLLFYPMALAGIILTNNIVYRLCNYMKFSVLNYIGRNSMTFYTTHWILFTFVTFIAKYLFDVNEPVILFLILLISGIIFLPMINKIINYRKAEGSRRC